MKNLTLRNLTEVCSGTWHGDDALRLGGLRVGEDVLPVDALVGLRDGEGPPLEVEPPRLQGEQLPLAHAAGRASMPRRGRRAACP